MVAEVAEWFINLSRSLLSIISSQECFAILKGSDKIILTEHQSLQKTAAMICCQCLSNRDEFVPV